jgi:hypothetical protein
MTEMICELSDAELDAVGGGTLGGSLVSFNAPFVVIGNSFNSQVLASQNFGVIAGNIGSTIGLGQFAGNLGFQTLFG